MSAESILPLIQPDPPTEAVQAGPGDGRLRDWSPSW